MLSAYHNDLEDIILLYTYGIDEKILHDSEMKARELGFQNIYKIQAQGVITTHAGPSGFGIVFCEK